MGQTGQTGLTNMLPITKTWMHVNTELEKIPELMAPFL
jgi:hypothetical protein